jgi:hypothetical protein
MSLRKVASIVGAGLVMVRTLSSRGSIVIGWGEKMTPFGLTLQHRLENETRRMQNEWFFKWHSIGRDRTVEIDSFDGRTLKYGGIAYSGSAREVYWDTLKRYISGKINDIFNEVESILSNYPIEMSPQIIEDTVGLLRSFNSKISNIAVEKDKILRGNGLEFPPPDQESGRRLLQVHNIEQRATALKQMIELKLAAAEKSEKTETKRFEEKQNMSFREFKENLLIAIAILAKGIPTAEIEPLAAAKARNLSYRHGWLRQAVKSLDEQGHVSARFYMGGGEDGGMPVRVTGAGLEYAEELCDNAGSDLYEEIDEHNAAATAVETESPVVVPASDRVVKIDHNSNDYKEIVDGLSQVSEAARKSNSLNIESADIKDQHLAEIDAGKRLLEAPQVNAGLVEKLLIPALKWISEKIAEAVIAAVVATLIALIVTLLAA